MKTNKQTKTNNDNQTIDDKAAQLDKIVNEKLTVEKINADPILRQSTVDKLLQSLGAEKTSKIDKRQIRRFLRQLGHKGGLRNSKYATTKSIADFVTT